ncbi:MAG: AcrB/AcrD/AcrF family protein [Bacteroidetes bacterium]|jgi:multidrug efflux pump subunit AcrB|nr:AcrB/AcrD/AcrF family protein [Bacteroidota bacterium]NBC26772.1 AcrB/AcrD/AcrF family protein [Bacteroidota bacterium]
MKIPAKAIENYRFVYIAVLLALLVGITAYQTMPRSEDPELSLPNYVITAVFAGTSPEDMEELIVDPLEDAIDEIDEITEITTSIIEGLAVIQIESEYGGDYDEKFDEIVREMNAVRPELPANMQELEAEQFKPEDRTLIMQLALISETAPWLDMYRVAEGLQNRIEDIPGVQNADIEAYPEEEIRISLDFQKMSQKNIPLGLVLRQLRSHNANIPGGNLKSGHKSLTIKTSGSYDSIGDIESTVITSSETGIVYLRDIARVFVAHEDIRWIGRHNGRRAIFLSVTRNAGENLVSVVENIQNELEATRELVPEHMSLEVAFEAATAVTRRIDDFFLNLLQGIVLVGLVIFLFLGFRSSAVIMTVIPLAIIISIGLLDIYGYGLQQISIASLVIALGLLVDNGIVVVENIVRFRKMGVGQLEAAAKGTSEVGYAIISSTLTTILAFAPLAFMQSGPGEFLRSLPVTVMTVLAISLLLALVLTPVLAGKTLTLSAKDTNTPADRLLGFLIRKGYEPALQFALRRGKTVLISALILFAGAGALFPFIGVSFFPTADKPMLLIDINTPYGVHVDETDRAVRFVESVLDTTAYVDHYTSNAGHGNPQVYYNRIPREFQKNHGQVLVNFKEWDPEQFYRALNRFQTVFETYPDAMISFRELKNGAPFNAPIEIRVIGENLDSLRNLSAQVEEIIRNTDGTKDVDNPLSNDKTDLSVSVNRDKAGMYGVSMLEIDQTVRAAMSGLFVDEATFDDNEEYPLVVRLPFSDHPVVTDFEKIYVSSRQGNQVPLKQLADIHYESSTAQIIHYNLDRSTSVTANVTNPDQTGAITQQIIRQLDELEWPEGYRYYAAGEYETQQESFGDLAQLLIIALIGIFAILVLQFHSFSQPLIIFSAIPLAVTGSFVALFLSGWSFSFFAFVGFISLSGIVVNNSIIFVDYANMLRKEGRTVKQALIETGKIRFAPILITTTTTIVGLMPLTFSATSLWSPLGWTIIGGMISSSLLTLLVVPVLYQWFSRKGSGT